MSETKDWVARLNEPTPENIAALNQALLDEIREHDATCAQRDRLAELLRRAQWLLREVDVESVAWQHMRTEFLVEIDETGALASVKP